MMKNKKMIRGLLPMVIAGAFSASQSHSAEYYFGSDQGTELQVNSEISIGASWRTEAADDKLIGPQNFMANTGSATSPAAALGSIATDDGNQNFDKGDTFSKIIKGTNSLSLTKDNYGAFARVKYWFDQQLENGNVEHGNNPNNYQANTPLSDEGFSDFAKFKGIALMDAYVYGSFDIDDTPVDVRVGRQVLSWGESTFIQGGMNATNPLDASAFRRPGATLKEGLLPVGMVMTSLGLTENLSVEAFYQYEWEKTQIDGCGTYFSTNDFGADGCDRVTIKAADATAVAAGLFAQRQDDIEAKDGGQYGLSARYFSEALNNTEFGVYFMNIHSRLPMISAIRTSMPGTVAGTSSVDTSPTAGPFVNSGHLTAGALSVNNPAYLIEFPEDLQYYGLSFATNVGGVALSGEVTYKPDTPVQINGSDVLFGTLTESSAGFRFAQRMIDAEAGAKVEGFDRFDVTQVQMTGIQFIENTLGAQRISLIGEVGAVLTDGIEDADQAYGRNPIFGPVANASGGFNGQPAEDGIVTDLAYGYRLKAIFDYSDVFAGVSLKPSATFYHDVKGYSPAPGAQFNEGSKTIALAVDAIYQQQYTASMSYKAFTGGDYNALSDHDFVSLSLGMTY
jgi:hypothetical protein